ncbi:NitT/TauT family transport system permease protein [Tistlia consotensis]|uniref:NitT/TauT family transport system permease protein n=1 Tax=Tistlia consotensis USBA 355 TaxID=560819 RepID=A0A1Y6BX57_9PROT|nr:ABC transporter permease [Tistlia consotensis]SMF29709.1 NitT/TauT family transport system permease protein [Tistlia consotensis USBA 355]SNR90937.1 NitT/TauT family transport system permease protein [Tistlia consotensis]
MSDRLAARSASRLAGGPGSRLGDGAAAVALLVAFALPVGRLDGAAVGWLERPLLLASGLVALAAALVLGLRRPHGGPAALLAALAVILGALGPLTAVGGTLETGSVSPGLWVYLAGLGWLAWRALELLSEQRPASRLLARAQGLVVPLLFGLWLLYLWQLLTIGFAVPKVLLPAPSDIWSVAAASTGTLWADFRQTFLKAVLAGFALGSASGFAVALLIDRVPFLQRGLLPLGSLAGAIPIVGIAPIMVMWFGFDWPSKAAVIVVMTFFPMLINTMAGLAASDRIVGDLMRSYGASYRQTLVKLRLPAALPFVFNALKINSTLALIGAIVAEFFGTPIVGMGFRISTEVGRLNVEMVWATIAVAAVSGSLFYGALALVERMLTFWHPSYRKGGT